MFLGAVILDLLRPGGFVGTPGGNRTEMALIVLLLRPWRHFFPAEFHGPARVALYAASCNGTARTAFLRVFCLTFLSRASIHRLCVNTPQASANSR